MSKADDNVERLAKTFVGRPSRSGPLTDDALLARTRRWIDVLRVNADMLSAYASTPFAKRLAWTLGKAADALEWGISRSAPRRSVGARR